MKNKFYKVIRVTVASIFSLCVFVGSAYAQDLLILKSGKELKVNIIQETNDVIQYREYENPAGPLYTVAKDKVASVKYKNGAKNTQDAKIMEPEKAAADILSQGSKSSLLTVKRKNVYLDGVIQGDRSVRLIMEDHPKSLKLYESGRTLCRLSNMCPYGIMITSFIFTQRVNKKETSQERIRAGIPGLVIDGGFLVAAIVMGVSGKSKIRNSVDLYNSAINKPVTYKLDLGLNGNGVGLTLKF